MLVVFAGLVWSAAAQKSETVDEGLFIALGVAQVEHADPNYDLTHPPLLRWLAGTSAMTLGSARLPREPAPQVPRDSVKLSDAKLQAEFGWSGTFFYTDGQDHDRVLFWGRFPFAFLAILTGLLIYREALRSFDRSSALGALAVFLFTPEILAHSQWAHSDLAATLATFLTALALARTLERESAGNDALLGAALGLAAIVKLTTLFLVPLCLGVLLFDGLRHEPGVVFLRSYLLRLARIAAVVWVVLVIGFLPQPRLLVAHEFRAQDLALLLHSPPTAGLTHFVQAVLRYVPLPDSFLKGVVYTLLLSNRGQIGWFHGQTGFGWWYYYPAAVLLKYPPTTLILALFGCAALLRSERLTGARKIAWTIVPTALLLLAMRNNVNIGVRTVLPLAAFFALWSAVALHWAGDRWKRRLAWMLVALSVLSGATAYPNFLAYFNPLAGGTAAADHWLVDSNYDWGQSLPQLKEALDRRGIERVHLAYFGMARPEHYGIEALPADVEEPGWYAISRSYLTGWWPPGDPYGWLREIPPVALPGGSIAIIRVRESDLPVKGHAERAGNP